MRWIQSAHRERAIQSQHLARLDRQRDWAPRGARVERDEYAAHVCDGDGAPSIQRCEPPDVGRGRKGSEVEANARLGIQRLQRPRW
jgi:hypothetical protein